MVKTVAQLTDLIHQYRHTDAMAEQWTIFRAEVEQEIIEAMQSVKMTSYATITGYKATIENDKLVIRKVGE